MAEREGALTFLEQRPVLQVVLGCGPCLGRTEELLREVRDCCRHLRMQQHPWHYPAKPDKATCADLHHLSVHPAQFAK